MIIDLKGQRAVASTDLMLEKGQEMDVIVRNVGGNRIILQIEPSLQQSIRSDPPAAVRLPLGDIMNQLVTSLSTATESAFPAMDETLKQLLLKVRKLVDRIPVSFAKGDLPQQIRNAINTLGYDYENKLANAIVKDNSDLRTSWQQFYNKLAACSTKQLKAELMKLQGLLNEMPLHDRSIQSKLLKSIDDMLQSIEFQQLKSVLNSEKSKYFYVQIPIICRDTACRVSTTQMEFFRPGTGNEGNDDHFDVKLDFNLDRLGHIVFFMRLISGHIYCQIMADQRETYNLVKNHSEDLRVRLTALGYSVDEIQCLRENPKAYAGVGSIVDTEDIDITV